MNRTTAKIFYISYTLHKFGGFSVKPQLATHNPQKVFNRCTLLGEGVGYIEHIWDPSQLTESTSVQVLPQHTHLNLKTLVLAGRGGMSIGHERLIVCEQHDGEKGFSVALPKETAHQAAQMYAAICSFNCGDALSRKRAIGHSLYAMALPADEGMMTIPVNEKHKIRPL